MAAAPNPNVPAKMVSATDLRILIEEGMAVTPCCGKWDAAARDSALSAFARVKISVNFQ
jgi:hypothetical protein